MTPGGSPLPGVPRNIENRFLGFPPGTRAPGGAAADTAARDVATAEFLHDVPLPRLSTSEGLVPEQGKFPHKEVEAAFKARTS